MQCISGTHTVWCTAQTETATFNPVLPEQEMDLSMPTFQVNTWKILKVNYFSLKVARWPND